jgi:hypothetical protein
MTGKAGRDGNDTNGNTLKWMPKSSVNSDIRLSAPF